jgi:hypothetical protein
VRHELRTEIDIDAPPAQVWAHLVELSAYADWNPFITAAEGAAVVGHGLTPDGDLRVRGGGVRVAGAPRRPGIFDGRHRFELTTTGTGTHLVQREWFRGVLVRPLRRSLDGSTRAGMEAMNAALRQRVREAPTV